MFIFMDDTVYTPIKNFVLPVNKSTGSFSKVRGFTEYKD